MRSRKLKNVTKRKETKEGTRLSEKDLDTQTRNAAAQMRVMAELDCLTATPFSVEKSKVLEKKPPPQQKPVKTSVLCYGTNVKSEKLSIEESISEKHAQPSNQSELVEPRAVDSTSTSPRVIIPPDDTTEHMQPMVEVGVSSVEMTDEEQARTLESVDPAITGPLLNLSGETQTDSPSCGVAETHGLEIPNEEPKQLSGDDFLELSGPPASENSPELDSDISSDVREMTKEKDSLGIEDSEEDQSEQQSDFVGDNVTSILVSKEVGSSPGDVPASAEVEEEGENAIEHGLKIIVPEDSTHEACTGVYGSHEDSTSGPESNESTSAGNVEGTGSVRDADILVVQSEEDASSKTDCVPSPSDGIKIPDDKIDGFQSEEPREAVHWCLDHGEDDPMGTNSLPSSTEPRLSLLAEHIQELPTDVRDQISEPFEGDENVLTEPKSAMESAELDPNESQAHPSVADERPSSPLAGQKHESMGTRGEGKDTSPNPATSEPQKEDGQEESIAAKHEAARVIQNQWQTTLVKRMLSEHVDLISRHHEEAIHEQDHVCAEVNEIERSSNELPIVLLNTSPVSSACVSSIGEGKYANDAEGLPGSSRETVLLNNGLHDEQEEGAEAGKVTENSVGLSISTPEAVDDDIDTDENTNMVHLTQGNDKKAEEHVGTTQIEAGKAGTTVTQENDSMDLVETNAKSQVVATIDDSAAKLPVADVHHAESDEKDSGRATEHLAISVFDTQSDHYDSTLTDVACSTVDSPAEDSPMLFSIVEKQTNADDSHHELDISFDGIIEEAVSRVVVELVTGVVDLVIENTNASEEILEKATIVNMMMDTETKKIEALEDCDTELQLVSCDDTPRSIGDENETPLHVVSHAVDLCGGTSPKAKEIESPTSFQKEENREDMASRRIQTQYRRYHARLLMVEEMRYLLQQRRRETRKKTRRESAQVATLLGVAAISETLGIKAGAETPDIQDSVMPVPVTGEANEDKPERIPTEVMKDRPTASEGERGGPREEEFFQLEAKLSEFAVVVEEETNDTPETKEYAEMMELKGDCALPESQYSPHLDTVTDEETNGMPVESGMTNQEDSVGSDPVEVADSSHDDVWERYMDPATNQPYYYHAKSMISQWEAPEDCEIIDRVEDHGAEVVNHYEDEEQGQSTGNEDGVELSVLVTQHSDVMEILLPTPSPSSSSEDGDFFEEQNSQIGTDTKNSSPVASVKPEEPESLAENTVKRRKFALGLLDLAMGSPREDEPVEFTMESHDNEFGKLELQAATEMLQPVEESGTWQEYVDPATQEKFYYNALTGESTWEVPVRVVPQATEKPQAQSPWVQYIDPETSLPYYVNMETYASSWDIPPDLAVTESRNETPWEQFPVEEEGDDDVEVYEIDLYSGRSSRQPFHPS
ncbi:hypothetical protein Poli38472_002201 [Pythium oligandrum]|uniref:WW domain-containing protein n=1 Tax=Pythium oligandrum TaxID=41045 RepID=A0A8K1CIC4_PYTOL|nr:hypothetical protein Poli38472_002201 [Pythium oligandrum]|eukprot:TMW63260.1 hypothetical protein Poli38472_002201 [Pythium oligandrum]